jgi:hypothetical protein
MFVAIFGTSGIAMSNCNAQFTTIQWKDLLVAAILNQSIRAVDAKRIEWHSPRCKTMGHKSGEGFNTLLGAFY